jgi:hypothetical protein
MSMKELDKLLGRSTIDPSIMQAFEEGRIVDLMAEFDFAPEVLHQLRGLEVRDFKQFAELAYQVVEMATEIDHQAQIPDPLQGLHPELILYEEEQVA